MSLYLMPSHVSLELDPMMRNFIWEGNSGGNVTHLVHWNLVSKAQDDGGLGIGALKHCFLNGVGVL